MLFDVLKIKKAIYVLFGASSLTLSGYYGIFVPMKINQTVELVPGSSSILKRSKTGTLEMNLNNKYFLTTNDFKNYPHSPSFDNSLKTDQLLDGDFENIGFSQDTLYHLNLSKQNTKKVNVNSWVTEGIGRDLKFLQKNSSSNEASQYAMSDIEIPNKPTVFLRTLHKMSKSDFIQDLIWSLAEESNNKKTIKKQ